MVTGKPTPEQLIEKLRATEVTMSEGGRAVEASRKIGMTEQTFYSWRADY